MRAPLRYPVFVRKRTSVSKLAVTDPVAALEVARSITKPWYRCQSLANVARHLQEPRQYKKVINEALDAAYEEKEPNRIVSVAAWPVNTMVQKRDARTAPVVDELLQKIQTEPNPVRQADALLLLFQAVYADTQLRDLVLAPLLRACEEMKSWKRPVILCDVARVLAIDDAARAEQVIESIGEGQRSRQAHRLIASGLSIGPREF